MPRNLLLIGGGHSHVEVVRRWGLAPEPGVNVTLVSPDRYTPYSGMLPGYIAGHYGFDDCHIDLDALCAQAGVTRISTSTGKIDFAARIAHCGELPDQPFDILSIDTGSTPLLTNVPGADRYGIAVKPVAQFLEHWAHLREAAQTAPRPLHVILVGAGAAGVEVILAMKYRIDSDKGHAVFTLIGDGPSILGAHPRGVQQRFMSILQDQQIAVRLDTAVERVSAGTLFLRGGETLAFDEVVWVTGAAAPAWPRASGLQTDTAGFIAVDKHLQSLSHPGVFAAGDIASMIDAPRPKSGVYAVRQGPPLAENLRQALRGETLLEYHPQARALALISAGERYAVASYGPLALSGAWVWHWKNRIDNAFMRRYRVAG